jgi:hypothetical protein
MIIPPDVPAFIDKIVLLQRYRQIGAPSDNGASIVFDRSPICTLALSRYSDGAPSRLLLAELDRILTQRVYEPMPLSYAFCLFRAGCQGIWPERVPGSEKPWHEGQGGTRPRAQDIDHN